MAGWMEQAASGGGAAGKVTGRVGPGGEVWVRWEVGWPLGGCQWLAGCMGG